MTDEQISQFQSLGRSLLGRPYKLGGKWDIANSHPMGPIDCSGFSRWIIFRSTGIVIPDGSYNQIVVCKKLDSDMQSKPPVLSLGFYGPSGGHIDHVVVVFDDEQVIEARGVPYDEIILRPIKKWLAQEGFLGFYALPQTPQ